MKNRRLLFVLWSRSDFGGLERRYLRLARFLAQQNNVRVELICQARALQSVDAIIGGSPVVRKHVRGSARIPWNPVKRIHELISIALMVRRSICQDVVFCGNPGFIAGILAVSKRSAQSLIVPNALLFVDLPLGFLDRSGFFLMKVFGASLDHLSEEPEQVFKRLVSDGGQQLRHHIAPCSFTDYSAVKSRKVRDIDILMLARFVDGKGYDLLESIDEHLRPYNAHFCGFGPRRIDTPNAEVYKADRPFDLLGRSKIFLSLQKGNNYPSQSLLEAMASGCAIIATDVGETRKILDESRAILIPYDADALRMAICKLIEDAELTGRLAKNARDFVLTHQTVHSYAQYFLDEALL